MKRVLAFKKRSEKSNGKSTCLHSLKMNDVILTSCRMHSNTDIYFIHNTVLLVHQGIFIKASENYPPILNPDIFRDSLDSGGSSGSEVNGQQ